VLIHNTQAHKAINRKRFLEEHERTVIVLCRMVLNSNFFADTLLCLLILKTYFNEGKGNPQDPVVILHILSAISRILQEQQE